MRRAAHAHLDLELARLRQLVVDGAPGSVAPRYAVGVKNVAIQIALVILQRCLVQRPQIRAVVRQQSLDILFQNRLSDDLSDFAKISASIASGRFLLNLLRGERSELTQNNDVRDGYQEHPRGG